MPWRTQVTLGGKRYSGQRGSHDATCKLCRDFAEVPYTHKEEGRPKCVATPPPSDALGQDLVGDQIVALVEVQLLAQFEPHRRREVVDDELPAVEGRPLHQESLRHNAANRAEQVEEVVVIQLLGHVRRAEVGRLRWEPVRHPLGE
jgi:hypothetical protein